MIEQALRLRLEEALGSGIVAAQPLAGGDINEAFRLDLKGGTRVFMKTHQTADPQMFPTEARGLAWLGDAQAIRLPEVLAVSSGKGNEPGFLALEYIEAGSPAPGFDETLGRELAALHRAGPDRIGLGHDNFIGRLPQNNSHQERWTDFYRDARLEPQVRLASDSGRIDSQLRSKMERLYARLSELVPDEPPARLHGDLWGGNLHQGEGGEPVLIDPAAYGGHREVDLAMMRLFGGFSPRTFAAYDEAWPLAPGSDRRVDLYQLYPLLVHVNLFGGGYVNSVRQCLDRLL